MHVTIIWSCLPERISLRGVWSNYMFVQDRFAGTLVFVWDDIGTGNILFDRPKQMHRNKIMHLDLLYILCTTRSCKYSRLKHGINKT